MLTNFEDITTDVTEYEFNVVMQVVRELLERRPKGKHNAITASQLVRKIQSEHVFRDGYKFDAIRVRKIISTLRLTGTLPCICSHSRGYYVAKTIDEMNDTVESLRQRIRQQIRVADAMEKQRDEWIDEPVCKCNTKSLFHQPFCPMNQNVW